MGPRTYLLPPSQTGQGIAGTLQVCGHFLAISMLKLSKKSILLMQNARAQHTCTATIHTKEQLVGFDLEAFQMQMSEREGGRWYYYDYHGSICAIMIPLFREQQRYLLSSPPPLPRLPPIFLLWCKNFSRSCICTHWRPHRAFARQPEVIANLYSAAHNLGRRGCSI